MFIGSVDCAYWVAELYLEGSSKQAICDELCRVLFEEENHVLTEEEFFKAWNAGMKLICSQIVKG